MNDGISEKDLERQHLLANYLNPLTLRALKNIALKKDAAILDLGCGIGESTRLLASRFPGSSITAVDLDMSSLDIAKRRKYELSVSTRFELADARHLPFAGNQFDFVFTRALLHDISAPLLSIQEMKRVAKIGGVVFAQEPDINFQQTYPGNWAYPQLVLFAGKSMADSHIGRKLISYFRFSLLEDVSHDAQVELTDGNTQLKRLFTLTAQALGEDLLQRGLADKNQIAALAEECKRVEEDKDNIVLANPVIAVWGTKR